MTGPCLSGIEPVDEEPQRVTAVPSHASGPDDSRRRVLDRILSHDVLPADLVERLRGADDDDDDDDDD